MKNNKTQYQVQPAKLGRRIGALIYDSLILLAILLFASVPIVFLAPSNINISHSFIYRGYLLLITIIFYHICWHQSGQTLGMRSWKIKLINLDDNKPISFIQSTIRVLTAIPAFLFFGLGYFMLYFNKQHATLHDLASGTLLVRRAIKS